MGEILIKYHYIMVSRGKNEKNRIKKNKIR